MIRFSYFSVPYHIVHEQPAYRFERLLSFSNVWYKYDVYLLFAVIPNKCKKTIQIQFQPTMTTAALSIGCLLIAFSPFFTFLFLLVSSKAQLTIVVTTSAFFFLCSSLLSSLIYLPFSSFLGTDSNWNLVIIIPSSVVSQTFLRCCFVHLYHRVENVVKKSIDQERLDSSSPPSETETNGHNDSKEKLRLELNDKTCALAAGCGFGVS